ncbi:hypothetical protein QJS10_CPB13g01165 [Acorus calamus]|uniref:Uncharacterized protein n=1 Tax=Acorus calamus TaxID=4465 RepID=A0AAV9DJF0_ACOCL|nr:hypothetical protein QJS10_CPB13g01165 [Acorus calamus]
MSKSSSSSSSSEEETSSQSPPPPPAPKVKLTSPPPKAGPPVSSGSSSDDDESGESKEEESQKPVRHQDPGPSAAPSKKRSHGDDKNGNSKSKKVKKAPSVQKPVATEKGKEKTLHTSVTVEQLKSKIRRLKCGRVRRGKPGDSALTEMWDRLWRSEKEDHVNENDKGKSKKNLVENNIDEGKMLPVVSGELPPSWRSLSEFAPVRAEQCLGKR